MKNVALIDAGESQVIANVTHHSGGGHVYAGHGTWRHVVGDMAQNYAVSKGGGQVLSQRHLRLISFHFYFRKNISN